MCPTGHGCATSRALIILYVETRRGYSNVCLDFFKGFDRNQNTNDISDSAHLVKSNLTRTWLYSDFGIPPVLAVHFVVLSII